MKQNTRRLSEGDGMSLEKKSFKIIQNKTNEKTCQGFDKPYSTRFGHLKGFKPRKVGILEAGKSDQAGCRGNGIKRYNIIKPQKYIQDACISLKFLRIQLFFRIWTF